MCCAVADLQQALAASPSLLATPRGQAHPRAVHLTGALQQHSISSGQALNQAWSGDPTLLQQELGLWLRKSERARLMQLWPQLVSEASEGPGSGSQKKRKKAVAEL